MFYIAALFLLCIFLEADYNDVGVTLKDLLDELDNSVLANESVEGRDAIKQDLWVALLPREDLIFEGELVLGSRTGWSPNLAALLKLPFFANQRITLKVSNKPSAVASRSTRALYTLH